MGKVVDSPLREVGKVAVASDGGSYLAVWVDHRPAHGFSGAHVTESGEVVERRGLRVTRTPLGQVFAVDLAWTGTHYVLAWIGRSLAGVDGLNVLRLGSDGAALDPAPESIAIPLIGSSVFRVAADGDVSLACWGGRSATQCMRIGADGSFLDSAPISLTAPGTFEGLAFGANTFLVVMASDGISAVRLSTSGEVLDPTPIAIVPAVPQVLQADVTFTSGEFVVGWSDAVSFNSPRHIRQRRVSPDGSLGDPSDVATSPNVADLRLIAGPVGTLFSWIDTQFIGETTPGPVPVRGVRVGSLGEILDASPVSLGSTLYYGRPSVAAAKQTFLTASGHNIAFGGPATAVVVSEAPNPPSERFAISLAANQQTEAVVGFDGENYVLVWSEAPNRTFSDLYSARLTATGQLLDPDGIPLHHATEEGLSALDHFPADLAFDGTNFLVVIEKRHSAILVQRIARTGAPVDPAPIEIHRPGVFEFAQFPVVAFGDGIFVVAWQSRSGVQAMRVGTDGRPIDSLPIPLGDALNGRPSIAFANLTFVIAWSDGDAGVFARALLADGSLPTSDRVQVSADETLDGAITVATDGSSFRVLWAPRDAAELRAVSVDSNLVPDSTVSSSFTGGLTHGLRAAFAGRYVLQWTALFDDDGDGSYDRTALYAGDVSDLGQVRIHGPLAEHPAYGVVSLGTANVVAGPAKQAAFGHARFFDDENLQVERAVVRTYDVGDDTDGDGDPDASDPDDDNDGVSDEEEIAAGSNPLDPASTPEVCDLEDNDGDGEVDEGFPTQTFYRDLDGDGYGHFFITVEACEAPLGFVDNDDDCAEMIPEIHPGATEVCDQIDNDCDGATDENEVCGVPDSDQDGIPDDEDVEGIEEAVADRPDSAFKSRGHRNAIRNALEEAEALIAAGDKAGAIQRLQQLRRKVDGCGKLLGLPIADNDDWITDCAAQREIRDLIDQLIANLRT